MEEILTFEALAEKENGQVSVLHPDYTDDFSDYMQKSIMESEQLSREALNSAAHVIIYR
jgi:chloramphenicol O-acetyltransferase